LNFNCLITRSFLCVLFFAQTTAFAQGSNSNIVLPDLGDPSPTNSSVSNNLAPKNSFVQEPAQNSGNPFGAAPNLTANSNPLSAAPSAIRVGEGGTAASLGANASDFRFESDDYLAHVGVQYASPKSNFGYGLSVDGAALLNSTVALGLNISGFSNLKEGVLNGVWMPEDTQLKMKLSAAYMWGQQNFDFYSGSSNANLNQASYYFSGQYVVPKETSEYLHMLGVSNWGTKANQTNNPDPVYLVTQTANSYQIMMDPGKLSTGTLQGGSFDTQLGLTKQIVTKLSVGYESLTFPYSDGTQDINKTVFQNYLVQYQPIENILLQVGYKMGAALNNLMASVGYDQFLLTGFKNNGNNGVLSDHGVMLTYRIPMGGTNSSSNPLNLLARPEAISGSAYVLRDAYVRPVQLPQTFLAKVDNTAVQTVATINKAGLPNGVSVNSSGDVVATVGVGGGTITGVTRNGSTFSYTSSIKMSGGQVVIVSKLLPVPTNGVDTYAIAINDSTGSPYIMTVTTQP